MCFGGRGKVEDGSQLVALAIRQVHEHNNRHTSCDKEVRKNMLSTWCCKADRCPAKRRGAKQSRSEQHRAFVLCRAEQSRAEQSRAEQSRAEQSRAEQSRTEQNRTEQNVKADSESPGKQINRMTAMKGHARVTGILQPVFLKRNAYSLHNPLLMPIIMYKQVDARRAYCRNYSR
jgi:hypothetical protein